MTTLVAEILAGRSLWYGLDYEPTEYLPPGGHMTLYYYGKFESQDEFRATKLAASAMKALNDIHMAAFDVPIDGVARFASQDTGGALVLLVDVSRVAVKETRERLSEQVRQYRDHSNYTPHITVKYLQKDEPVTIEHVEPKTVRFTHVTLNCGDYCEKKELISVPVRTMRPLPPGSQG